MTHLGRRPSQRETLLDAALAIVRDRGAGRLTIEAVATLAGTTKGGVMYHFAAKDDLLAALVDRARRGAAAELDAATTLAAERGCAPLEAYVIVALSPEAPAPEAPALVNAGLIGAAAIAPALLDPFRAFQEDRFRRLSADGIPPARVALVLAAMDGIWLSEVLGVPAFAPALRRDLTAALVILARGEGA